MLSQTAEYALRAIVFLADHHGEPKTAEMIAETSKVPLGYLAKILQGLARNGLIVSQRGLHGGFTLLRSPADVTLYDVVQATDPISRITTCPLNLPGHGTDLCPLHRRLDNAALAVETAFRRTTISQLLSEPTSSRPLCNFPRITPVNPASAAVVTRKTAGAKTAGAKAAGAKIAGNKTTATKTTKKPIKKSR